MGINYEINELREEIAKIKDVLLKNNINMDDYIYIDSPNTMRKILVKRD